MPEFGGVDTGLHFEFLQGVDRRQEGVGVEVDVGVCDTVERIVVELAALATDREVLSRPASSLAAGCGAAVRIAGIYVGAECDQLDEVSPVERQFNDALIIDYGAERC